MNLKKYLVSIIGQLSVAPVAETEVVHGWLLSEIIPDLLKLPEFKEVRNIVQLDTPYIHLPEMEDKEVINKIEKIELPDHSFKLESILKYKDSELVPERLNSYMVEEVLSFKNILYLYSIVIVKTWDDKDKYKFIINAKEKEELIIA